MTAPRNAQSGQGDQDSDLDPDALAAIRNMIQEEPKAKAAPRRWKGRAASQEDAVHAKPQAEANKTSVSGASKLSQIKKRLRDAGVSRKHVIWGVVLLLAVLRPWLVIGLVVVSMLIVAGVFLALGHDTFWKRVIVYARRYARRNPERAAELHQQLDSFALAWDSILDRFPEGSVDGMYLPDFGELAQADAKYDAALDRRFKDMREGEV